MNQIISNIEPSPRLKQHIKNYIVVELNRSEFFLPVNRVLPEGNATLVFHYGTPSKFKKQIAPAYIEPRMVLCGQQSTYYDLALAGNTGMIIVVFRPHGLKSFFGFSSREASEKNISLEEVTNKEANILKDRLLNAKNNPSRIQHIEQFLLKKLSIGPDFSRVEHAVNLIEKAKGQIKTDTVAHESCLGIKQFERVFTKYIGLNPKKYAGIVRFQTVLQLHQKKPKTSMFDLAVACGYYDQAHFIHDFKKFTGSTPRRFFKDKDDFLQF